MQHYITAWTTNDPQDIRALFTEDAVYATSPQEAEPWQGRDDIVEHWIAGRDEPDDWTFEWKLLGVDGGRAFVQGLTTYRGNSRSYDNLWIIQLIRRRPRVVLHRVVHAAQVALAPDSRAHPRVSAAPTAGTICSASSTAPRISMMIPLASVT